MQFLGTCLHVTSCHLSILVEYVLQITILAPSGKAAYKQLLTHTELILCEANYSISCPYDEEKRFMQNDATRVPVLPVCG